MDFGPSIKKILRILPALSFLINSMMYLNCKKSLLKVADQSGRALDIPPEEKKALIIAMSLHEKGKAALAKADYSLGKAVPGTVYLPIVYTLLHTVNCVCIWMSQIRIRQQKNRYKKKLTHNSQNVHF